MELKKMIVRFADGLHTRMHRAFPPSQTLNIPFRARSCMFSSE